MIVNTILGFFLNTLSVVFSGLEIIGLPLELINTLQTILVYGVWIVGADILGIFVSMVVGWWTIKFTIGFVVWLLELLPFT